MSNALQAQKAFIKEELTPSPGIQFFVSWRNGKGALERGPIQLLWDLIESYQVDIFDVSLERLTRDFLEFLEHKKRLELDLTASFIRMAARLVYYKGRALLPNLDFEETEEEDGLPPELVEQLLEYRKYQAAAEKLRLIEEISSGMYTRDPDPFPKEEKSADPEGESYLDLSITDLVMVYSRLLRKLEAEKKRQEDLSYDLEEYSVSEQISYLETLLEKLDSFTFEEIFEDPKYIRRGELITSFLALLELTKQGRIIIRQKNSFGEIRIFKQNTLLS